MADHQGYGNGALRPFVPIVNVEICATDARTQHFDEDIVNANGRLGHIFHPQANFSFAFD